MSWGDTAGRSSAIHVPTASQLDTTPHSAHSPSHEGGAATVLTKARRLSEVLVPNRSGAFDGSSPGGTPAHEAANPRLFHFTAATGMGTRHATFRSSCRFCSSEQRDAEGHRRETRRGGWLLSQTSGGTRHSRPDDGIPGRGTQPLVGVRVFSKGRHPRRGQVSRDMTGCLKFWSRGDSQRQPRSSSPAACF